VKNDFFTSALKLGMFELSTDMIKI
jgi:hypothetical protein